MPKFRWESTFQNSIIGKIPKDWMIRKLDDISEISSGGTPSRKVKEYWDGTINWLKSQEVRRAFVYDTEEKISVLGMNRSSARKIYPPDTVVLALYGATAGEVALLKTSSTINQAIAALEGRIRECNNHFLFYSLMQNKERLLLETTGAAQQNLYLKMVKEFTIPLPSYEEQCRVASVLSWFDDLIENKKRQNEVLEKTAMAIFKSWFMDFEPFKDGEFVPSELGEIPKECDVKPLEEVATLYKGVSYNSSEISSEPQGNLFITLNNFVREGGFKLEYDYYIGSKAKEEHRVKEGDLIIALTDMTPLAKVVGSPAMVSLPYGYDFGVISLDCGKLQPRKECLRFYLYLYLKQTQEENSTFANGVNVLHLNTNLFMRNKLILIPPELILEKFHSLVEPLFRKITINQKQILIIRRIRDTLLPLLVFGKLRVEEI
jgi:type I restriction enzyme S subunit